MNKKKTRGFTSEDFLSVTFGLLDLALFAYVFYALGPPWTNKPSIIDVILSALAIFLGGGDIMDFVAILLVAIIALCAIETTFTVKRWIKEKPKPTIDWKHISKSETGRPFLASQAALLMSTTAGLLARSPVICYVTMLIFMVISAAALSLEL